MTQINFNLTFLRAYAPSQSRGRTKEIKWSLKILNKQNKKVTLFPQAIQLPLVWQAYLGPFDSVLAWEKMSRLEWMWNMECVALIVRFSVHITKFLCEIYKGNSRPFKIPRLKWTIFKQVALKFSKLAHINTLFLVTGIFSVQLIKRRLRTCLKWNTFTYVFDIRVLNLTYDLYSFWYLENRKMVWVMHSAYIYI